MFMISLYADTKRFLSWTPVSKARLTFCISTITFSFPRSAWECIEKISASAPHMHSHAEHGNEAGYVFPRGAWERGAYAFPRGAWERGGVCISARGVGA